MYFFAKTCVDFDDGNDVQEIVGEDDDYAISKEEFFKKAAADPADHEDGDTYGFNKSIDVMWAYKDREDVHLFYTTSGYLD